jgi:hypothetical protein
MQQSQLNSHKADGGAGPQRHWIFSRLTRGGGEKTHESSRLRSALVQDISLQSEASRLLSIPKNGGAVIGGIFFAAACIAVLLGDVSLKTLLDSYQLSMVENPLPTKAATGATLAFIGDGLAQLKGGGTYCSQRAMSFAFFDSCNRMFQHFALPAVIFACQGQMLGGLISRILPTTLSNGAQSSGLMQLFATTERTIAYQFVVTPFFYYPVFFTLTGLLQGLSVSQTFERAKALFMPCWRTNLIFWIPVQMIMFGLVDEKWQIPFACIMGIVWSSILSIMAGKVKR